MSRKLRPTPKLSVASKKPPSWQRQRNISLIIRITIPLIILIAAGLVGYWGYDTYVAVWNQRVAKVNETTLDMDYYVKMLRFHALSAGTTSSAPDYAYQVLRTIEDYEVLRQGASKLDVHTTSDEISDWIEDYLVRSYTGGTNSTQVDLDLDELYKNILEVTKLSDGEYRRMAEIDVLSQKVIDYLKESEVPEEGEHVYLHAILIEDSEKAVEASQKLKAGGNFTDVAKEYFAVEELKERGGDIGWMPRGIYPAEVDAIAFDLEVGNVTEPILTSQGYYIIKISDKTDSMPIKSEHREILAGLAFGNWFQQERTASSIVEYLDQKKINWALEHV